MRLGSRLSAVLFGAAMVIAQPLVATALTTEKLFSIAQQITVRIDGADTGSGIILEHQGNTYTILTNRHVFNKKGSYTAQTPDGKQYTFNQSQVKEFPQNVDLATFEFKSNQNYSVAEKGDSDQVTGGKTIYVAGYPDGIPKISGRIFQLLPTSISGRAEKPTPDGYELVYSVNAFPGTSGGPILDEQGKLVGIHGLYATRPDTNAAVTLGIPLKTYFTATRPDTNATLAYGIPLKTYSRCASRAAYISQNPNFSKIPSAGESYNILALANQTTQSSLVSAQAGNIIAQASPYASIAQQGSNSRVLAVRNITEMINNHEIKFRGEIGRSCVS